MSRWLVEHRWYRTHMALSRVQAAWWVLMGRGVVAHLTIDELRLGPGRVFVIGNTFRGNVSGAGVEKTRLEFDV